MFRSLNRNTLVCLAGMVVGVLGLVIQWAADPAKFSEAQQSLGVSFPPGIAFIAVCGVLTLVTSRWWWHPAFGVLIAFWIVGVGTLAGQLTPNLVSPNAGTVTGNVVMAVGLVVAALFGVLGMIAAVRARRPVGQPTADR